MKIFKFCKFGTAFALSLILTLGITVPAYSRISDDSLVAGYQLAEIIELIMNRYVGGPVTVDELLESALRGMTDMLDEYSVYLNAEELRMFSNSLTGRMRGIGIVLTVRNDDRVAISSVLPDSPASYVGLLPGDIISYVDGEFVAGMPLNLIRARITNPETDWVLLGIERNGTMHTFNIEKAEIISPTVVVERVEVLPEAHGLGNVDNFRVMQIRTVGLLTAEDVGSELAKMHEEGVQGIILDLRGNTGGCLYVTLDLANLLIPQGTVLQTVNHSGNRRTFSSTLPQAPFDNIVVLVDRFTASAAEIIASALQDSGVAVVIGEPTFGKGSVQTVYELLTGGALFLTTEEYFRRSGETINNVGVTPCITVTTPRRAGEIDQVLRTGIETLLRGVN